MVADFNICTSIIFSMKVKIKLLMIVIIIAKITGMNHTGCYYDQLHMALFKIMKMTMMSMMRMIKTITYIFILIIII